MADGESASPSSSAVSQSTHSDSDSESVASEHEYSSSHASSSDLRPPLRKKGKSTAGTGKFKSSWRLPPHITASSKGSRFAYCKVSASNFFISHGGLNDIKRHVGGCQCCELSSFDDSLLDKAKSCTNQRNISYKS